MKGSRPNRQVSVWDWDVVFDVFMTEEVKDRVIYDYLYTDLAARAIRSFFLTELYNVT
jgi:hypothetical protein